MRLAVWSGPRNLSTAMMYSFGARSDFAIWDEPFYAAYLARSGVIHPMNDEILAAGNVDPDAVAAACIGSIPAQKPHFYMKHMPHHMLDGFPTDWIDTCVNVHLIRHPARVIASYDAKRDAPEMADIGFEAQWALYQKFGGVIVDSADIRCNPEAALKALCAAIDLPWDPAMLQWPAGGRAEDGVWARHWYGAIHASTGFAGPEGPLPKVRPQLSNLSAQALDSYEKMYELRLNVEA